MRDWHSRTDESANKERDMKITREDVNAPTIKASELLDILTNPKWWPDGKIDLNVDVRISVCPNEVTEYDMEQRGEDPQCIAFNVYHAAVHPVNGDRVCDEDQLDQGVLTLVLQPALQIEEM
jgi:hypothetical protein